MRAINSQSAFFWDTSADTATSVTGEGRLREGGRGDGDGAHCSLREDERIRPQQGRPVQEGAGHSVQFGNTIHVEEGIHAGVLSRPQINEFLLSADQADETDTRTQDVRQGTMPRQTAFMSCFFTPSLFLHLQHACVVADTVTIITDYVYHHNTKIVFVIQYKNYGKGTFN